MSWQKWDEAHKKGTGRGFRTPSVQRPREATDSYQTEQKHLASARALVRDWVTNATLHGSHAPSDEGILGTKKMVPKGPITVYRAASADPEVEGRKVATAWTRNRGIAQSLVDEQEEDDPDRRELHTRVVHPHEVLFDTKSMRENVGHDLGSEDYDEVVVAHGPLKERMNRLRGDDVTSAPSSSHPVQDTHSSSPFSGVEKAKAVVRDAKAGMSVSGLATKHGWAEDKIRTILKNRGVKPRG